MTAENGTVEGGSVVNIQFQVCGLVIILVLMILYVRKAILWFNTQRMFRNMFCSLFLCLSFDILSLLAIYGKTDLPGSFVTAVCKIYLATLVCVALSGFLYVYVDLEKRQHRMVKGICFYMFLAILDIVGIFFAPIYIYRSGDVAYTYGSSVLITYAGAAGFVFYNLFSIIKNKDRLNPRRRNSMAIWLSVWMIAAILQFFRQELLIIGFAGAIGTMIVYMQMENPELFIDRSTGFFNAGAQTEYLEMKLGRGDDFAVLTILIRYGFHRGGMAKANEKIMLDLARRLKALPQAKSFRVGDSELQIIFDRPEIADAYVEEIPGIFRTVFGQYDGRPSAEYIFVPNSSMVVSATKLSLLIQYINNKGLASKEKGIFRVTDGLVENMENEFRVTAYMKEAIRHEERIEVFYQPIYDTKNGGFTSAEALVRMRGRDGKLIPPGDFIPIAESNGIIIQIGKIVFDKVCRFFVENDLAARGISYIEVNLSMLQCVQNDLADTYIGIMEKHHINAANINLEITESATMEEKQQLLQNMKTLINYGVSFSLDDFGTGQSNLNYIMEMPVHIVKFDKGMTDAYFENDRAKYIMDTAIQMIHGMGLEIVSEGVETRQEYDTLRNKGIGHIQGYYFSRPLPGKEFLQFLDGHNAGKDTHGAAG